MAMFAKRTHWEMESNELSKLYDSLETLGTPLINLTESNPTHCRFNFPINEILSALSLKQNLSYEPKPFGSNQAREAVSRYYAQLGFSVDPGHIVLTASTSESYSYLLRLLADPHDHVCVPRPSYPLFQFLADLNDVSLNYYSLQYDQGWTMNDQSLKEAVHETTRAIMVVNPNNPTGTYLKEKELQTINQLCRQKNIALISDEVFYDYQFENNLNRPVSVISNHEVLSFTLGGASKSLALPQMKIGWIVLSGPEPLVQDSLKRLEVIADTYLSVSTPSQNALTAWLSCAKEIQSEILDRIRGNRRYAEQIFRGHFSCQCLRAEGGWYLIVKLPQIKSEEEWALEFLKECHVFTHPGYFFDFDDEPFAVISLLLPADVFKEGIDRIVKRTS